LKREEEEERRKKKKHKSLTFSVLHINLQAMRFPEGQKPQLETDKEIRKRESEIAKGLEEEEDEF
jgi:hypothetical protein